jgi:hypothetical protein
MDARSAFATSAAMSSCTSRSWPKVTLLKIGTNPRTGVPTSGFDAQALLRRSDFGLGKYIPQVGDTVPVRLTSQAAEAAEAGKAPAAPEAAR